MDDLVKISAAELASLRERVSRLSREKAHLTLVVDLINRLGSVAGLENTVDHILSTLMDTIGGANLELYYRIEGEIRVADVYGRRERVSEIDDPLVREALENRAFASEGVSDPPGGASWDDYRAGAVWVFPLFVGDESVGALRMEGMRVAGPGMQSQLQAVFHYAAMTLRGEIQNYSRLKAAYDAVRHSEERFRSVVSTAHDGILLIEGGGRIAFWNAAAESIFGYSAEEAVGRDMPFVVPEELRDRHRERLERMGGEEVVPAGKVIPVEGVRSDGSRIPLELTLADWKSGDEAFCTVVVRDIRARREAEEALRQSEAQLRQALKMEAVGRLAGGVAHDFNNLLTVITGYSDMTLRRLDPASQSFREVEEIRRAGARAAALTQQLLAFSRRQVMQPAPIDLNAVVNGMAGMLRRLIGEDILLVVELAEAPGAVMADVGQIEQVVVNLAVNARDAMPGGGTLSIRTGRVTPDAQFLRLHPGAVPVPHVALTISDTGSGMDAETQAHLFEPFFTTKPVGKGTGLGLSTVYGIVAQSGGHIEVRSGLGEGTEFSICFPVVAPAAPAGREPDESAMPGGRGTILVVEDEPSVRALVREILEELGYRTLAAGNGFEALEQLERSGEAVDLLITDVVMPRMNGRELAARIARLRPSIRMLFISGYTDHDSVPRGAFPAGSLFLQKPFTPDALARKVRDLLASPASPPRNPD